MTIGTDDGWRPKPARDDPRNPYQYGYTSIALRPDGVANMLAEEGERIEREWMAGEPFIRMTMLPGLVPTILPHDVIRYVAHVSADADARIDAYTAYAAERDADD